MTHSLTRQLHRAKIRIPIALALHFNKRLNRRSELLFARSVYNFKRAEIWMGKSVKKTWYENYMSELYGNTAIVCHDHYLACRNRPETFGQLMYALKYEGANNFRHCMKDIRTIRYFRGRINTRPRLPKIARPRLYGGSL